MAEVRLFNLLMGQQPPDVEWRSAKVGPFTVSLVEDYAKAVGQLSRKAQVRVSMNWTRSQEADQSSDESAPLSVLTKEVEHTDSVPGGWVVTAMATCSDSNNEQSILAREPIADGGVVCQRVSRTDGMAGK